LAALCPVANTGTVSAYPALSGEFFPEEAGMNKSDELRQNADNCVEMAQSTDSDPKKKRFERMAEGWNSVAETQAWLDGEMTRRDPKTA
jgi:hypothetical protein